MLNVSTGPFHCAVKRPFNRIATQDGRCIQNVVTMDARTHPSQPAGASASRAEAQLRLLVQTGLLLASERSLDVIVQAALDAGLELSGAAVGAFFYNRVGENGETYQLYKVSGSDAGSFAGLSMPHLAELFAPAFANRAAWRSDDVMNGVSHDGSGPFRGEPSGHLPVRSYLAVPVRGRGGEALGAMLYGHPEPARFAPDCENLVAAVASQTGVAIENARLTETVTREVAVADNARQLQRATAHRLEEVLESTTDGVLLLDRHWRVTFINRFAKQLLMSGRNVLGRDIWELFPAAVGTTFELRYREAMWEKQKVEFTEFFSPLDLWVYVRAFPTEEGIAIFFQDVTRQKAAERERAETLSRLRQALDAGQLGTWTWDRHTDMLDFDERAAELWDVKPHTPLPRSEVRERQVLREDLAHAPESLIERMWSGDTYITEYRIRSANNVVRWIATTGIPTLDPDTGEMIGMSGTFQDITARKTQEATLRQSEKLAATGRLAATIAHEINNPLEAVTNLIFLCKTDPTVPAGIQRLLETADNELARVAQIAQQTLGFYRDTTRPAEIDVAALLASVVDLFSRKLLSKKVVCTLDVARDLRIVGLHGEIKQVFSNLLVNAIDASRTNTTIRIRGKRAFCAGKNGVSVLMSDQGTGIPKEIRERLFSPFFTTKEAVGTGLGLWVTRGIVEKQGGCITFRSCTGEPSGTVFRVFLPTELQGIEAFASPQSQILQ